MPKTGKKYAKSTQTDNEKMKTEGFWIKTTHLDPEIVREYCDKLTNIASGQKNLLIAHNLGYFLKGVST